MDQRPGPDLAADLAADVDGAFPAFVDRFGGDVFTLARRVSDASAAEDIAQDAFVRAHKALRSYSPSRTASLELRPWVLTIALNVARNHLRTASRRTTVPMDDGRRPSPSRSHPDPAVTASDRLDLAGALASLPLAARQAVVLRHVIGCSTAETAAVLGRPEGTVKAQVSRALAAMRDRLEDRP